MEMGRRGKLGGHPHTPGREDPAPLYVERRIGGHPQTPGREDPAPLWEGGRGEVGGHPQTPGKEGPAPRGRSRLGLVTWLFPKPFDNVSSLLYLGTFLLFLYDGYRHNYGRSLEWGSTVVVAVALFALLLADRWDFWFYEGAAPNRIAALLLATRM